MGLNADRFGSTSLRRDRLTALLRAAHAHRLRAPASGVGRTAAGGRRGGLRRPRARHVRAVPDRPRPRIRPLQPGQGPHRVDGARRDRRRLPRVRLPARRRGLQALLRRPGGRPTGTGGCAAAARATCWPTPCCRPTARPRRWPCWPCGGARPDAGPARGVLLQPQPGRLRPADRGAGTAAARARRRLRLRRPAGRGRQLARRAARGRRRAAPRRRRRRGGAAGPRLAARRRARALLRLGAGR